MGNISLYRRYRSQDFGELIGQEHIRTTLQNALAAGKTAAAYLFSGPRGTGKTSTARILAKAINCVNGPTATPCSQCEACLSITSGNCLDVIELDAASYTGVDDVREVIVTKVHFPPSEVRRKVYIVDEVHKLSNSAFNALLKTLEEPPAHVVFILATTDPQNVPATILSRCQRFEFHRIDHASMVRHLRHVCQAEHIVSEEGALHAIADAAEGAMRDALVILEQVAAQGEVLEGNVLSTLGLTPHQALSQLTEHLLAGQTGPAIHLLHELQNQGKDPAQLARDMLEYLRKLLLYRVSPDPTALLSVPSALHDKLKLQSAQTQPATIYRLLRLVMTMLEEMREATWTTILWETSLVQMAHPELDARSDALAARVAALEQQLASGVRTPSPPLEASPRPVPPPPARLPVTEPPPPRPASPPATPQTVAQQPLTPAVAAASASPPPPIDMTLPELWKRLLTVLQRKESGPLFTFIAEARPLSFDSDKGLLTLSMGQGKAFQKERIEMKKETIESAATELLARPVRLRVVMEGEAPAAPPGKVHENLVKNTMEIFPSAHIVE